MTEPRPLSQYTRMDYLLYLVSYGEMKRRESWLCSLWKWFSISTWNILFKKRGEKLAINFQERGISLMNILMRKEVSNFILSILLKLWIITALLAMALYFRSAFQCSPGPGQSVKSDASPLLPMRPNKVDSYHSRIISLLLSFLCFFLVEFERGFKRSFVWKEATGM